MSIMELQSLRPPGELPAEDIASYEPSPYPGNNGEAEHLPGTPQDWPGTMTDRAWEEEDGALTVQLQASGESAASIPVQGELLRKLSALHLAEGHRHGEECRTRSPMDARYPEPLATEESPRRRARSLPWTPIPEVEDEDDSLMCCCKLKKKVQFADSLGLCLASVKHFLPSDEPLVPQSVLARLQSYPPTVPQLQPEEDMVVCESPAPAELLARLAEHRVCLEQVSASAWGVKGHILVADPGDGAQVRIRYTFNEWLSFLDCPASDAQQSTAPGTQRFHFNLCYPPSTSLIHFAICFTTSDGQEIWDNNNGANYTVSCHNWLPEVQPCSPGQEESRGPHQW
ncbi:protein phosphatase 1 regulatory subunit 3G [Anomaloglossus baeobatrachus]|uniref:protein phosphatase 1 regulatory subunit 3G n=1 Tax=Anomaloglossus baeobatrachus TaxID=238106 RepID=UPI003F50D2FE